MTTRIKVIATLIAMLASLAGGFILGTKRNLVPTEGIVNHDVIKYVDRIVTKHSVETRTSPDGSRVVIESNTNSQTVAKTRDVLKETTVIKRPAYSVGLMLLPKLEIPLQGDYQLSVGRRVSNSSYKGILLLQVDQFGSNPRLGFGIEKEF